MKAVVQDTHMRGLDQESQWCQSAGWQSTEFESDRSTPDMRNSISAINYSGAMDYFEEFADAIDDWPFHLSRSGHEYGAYIPLFLNINILKVCFASPLG